MNKEVTSYARTRDVVERRSWDSEIASLLSLGKEANKAYSRHGEKYLIVSIPRGDSLAIGTTIADVDREFRRTIRMAQRHEISAERIAQDLVSGKYQLAEVLEGATPRRKDRQYQNLEGRTDKRSTRPVEDLNSSTQLLAFSPGSGHMLFGVLDWAWQVLTGDQLSAMLNLIALRQGQRWVGMRVRAFLDLPPTLSPQDMLELAARNGGDLGEVLGQTDHDIRLGQTIEARRITSRMSLVEKEKNDKGKVVKISTFIYETFE